MTVNRYDVIVVGAGPAGSTAAAETARAGLRTLLLEKHGIPRHKTCGGGVPMGAARWEPGLLPTDVVETRATRMRHTWCFGDAFTAPLNPPGADDQIGIWMVQRAAFDAALARRAANAGADLRDGAPVRAVELGSTGVRVTVSLPSGACETIAADVVVGADGANGVTASAAGLRRDRVLAIGMEVELPHRWGDGAPDLRPDTVHLEYGAVGRGYAWVFPKAEHLNIGAGMLRPGSPDGCGDRTVAEGLRATILRYADSLGLRPDPSALHFHAHPLPLWSGREPLGTRDGRILLCGDAAGLVGPLFGDGIRYAIRSGVIAAACLAEGCAADYTRRLHAALAANHDAALRIARVFYAWGPMVYRYAVRRPDATRAAARLLCGEASFADVAGRTVRRIITGAAG